MDPHLLDLIWQVYRQSGSHDYIQVVCGYRSPPTNAMLRRRSNGVAKNSMHMQGKAMDFYIPDVPLAKLRAIGLRMQIGGVGFYPTSGSPFVHMDTGSVRHWPRMTRQQLVRVFPNGNTLHVPSDGKPLPGYAEALAAYQARKAGMTPDTKVASFGKSPVLEDVKVSKPVHGRRQLDRRRGTPSDAASPLTAGILRRGRRAPADQRAVGTAVASYATAPVPLPRLAPRPAQPVAVAALDRPRPTTSPRRHGRRSTSPRSPPCRCPTIPSAIRRTGRRRPFPPRSPPPWPNATRPGAAPRCRSRRPRSWRRST